MPVDPEIAEQVRQVRGTVTTIIDGYLATLDYYHHLIGELRRHTTADALAAALGPGRGAPTGGGRPSGHAEPTAAAVPRLSSDPILQAHRDMWVTQRKALERRCESLERYLASLQPDPTPTENERRTTDLMMLHQYPRPA